MTIRIALAFGIAGLIISGCSVLKPKKDPTRFYELTVLTNRSEVTPSSSNKTAVVAVEVAGYLQNQSLAQRVAPNQISYLPFDQWAQPFGEGVDQALRGDLAALTGLAAVRADQSYITRDAVRIDVEVARFDLLPQHGVQLAAAWQIRATLGGPVTHQGTFDQSRPYSDDPTSLQPAVAALNELVHELSRAIAADLPK